MNTPSFSRFRQCLRIHVCDNTNLSINRVNNNGGKQALRIEFWNKGCPLLKFFRRKFDVAQFGVSRWLNL